MRITITQPSIEMTSKIRAIHPDLDVQATEVIEFEIPWYDRDYWLFLWWGFIMWICETIVPKLKDRPNYISVSLGKSRLKTKRTK